MKEFTILVPLYNEEENIERLATELGAYVKSAKIPSQVLFIDDGSTDKSLEKLQVICRENANFDYISFVKNRGLSMALKAGFDHTKTSFVGYIDADLQTIPLDFDRLLPFRKDFAMVTGIRQNRQDGFIKKISSKIANGFRRMMVNDGVADTGCPLKVFRTDVARQLPFFNGNHRFYAALVQMFEVAIKEVAVQHFPREAGTAKFGLRNRLIAPFFDCFHVRWLQKRHRNYTLKK